MIICNALAFVFSYERLSTSQAYMDLQQGILVLLLLCVLYCVNWVLYAPTEQVQFHIHLLVTLSVRLTFCNLLALDATFSFSLPSCDACCCNSCTFPCSLESAIFDGATPARPEIQAFGSIGDE
jgi:hypothetical protein